MKYSNNVPKIKHQKQVFLGFRTNQNAFRILGCYQCISNEDLSVIKLHLLKEDCILMLITL